MSKGRKTVKSVVVREYLEANWPVSKSAIVADTGVSPSYAYKMLREYELEQQRLGNISSDGTLTRYEETATLGDKPPRVHSGDRTIITPLRFRASEAKSPLKSTMQVSAGTSDGSTASYYELPDGAAELQDLISHKNMNAQIGEIFRAAYRYGESSHSDELRDAKKIRFYIDAEIKRLGG